MISGRLAFGDLTLEFGHAERRFDEVNASVDRLTRQCERLVELERDIIEELARIYMPDLSPESLSGTLREMEHKMRGVLEEHVAYRSEVEAKLTDIPADIAKREAGLAEAEAEELRRAEALAEVRESIEGELADDAGFVERVAEHRALMERRSILKTRRARLQSTANVERHNYEQNEAFAYLMGRQWGEPGYAGGFLTRWLDRRLAKRIDYETLAERYRILRTGPHAIHAEMRRLTERAEELEAETDARQAEADERLGLVAVLEAHGRAQTRLVKAREALAEVVERRDALDSERRALAANRGAPYQAALRAHAHYLEDQSVRELLSIAERTPDPRDDRLVIRLDEVRDELHGVQSELDEQSRQLERLALRTNRMGEILRKVKRRFTSRRSFFPEEGALAEIVRSVVDGDVESDALIQRIEQQHRAEPVLRPMVADVLEGWFAELSSIFDPELNAVTVEVQADEGDGTDRVVVYDADGRRLHRRVTRRRTSMSPDSD